MQGKLRLLRDRLSSCYEPNHGRDLRFCRQIEVAAVCELVLSLNLLVVTTACLANKIEAELQQEIAIMNKAYVPFYMFHYTDLGCSHGAGAVVGLLVTASAGIGIVGLVKKHKAAFLLYSVLSPLSALGCLVSAVLSSYWAQATSKFLSTDYARGKAVFALNVMLIIISLTDGICFMVTTILVYYCNFRMRLDQPVSINNFEVGTLQPLLLTSRIRLAPVKRYSFKSELYYNHKRSSADSPKVGCITATTTASAAVRAKFDSMKVLYKENKLQTAADCCCINQTL